MANTPFSLVKDRYDMDTYWGRLQHRLTLSNPLLMFDSTATLRSYQATLQRFREGKSTGKTNDELWHMRAAIESSVHPTTNEVLNPLVRMAAYVPVNVPIVLSMTLPAVVMSAPLTACVHIINQSYNCAVNYANRSGDSQPVDAILTGYGAALTTSLAGALGATMALKRAPSTGAAASIIRGTLPYTAVCVSGSANVCIMRWNEWRSEGVPITDEDGEVRGKSVSAARSGILKCCASRFLWNVPPMMLPPLMTAWLGRKGYFAGRAGTLQALETSVCLLGVLVGVPMALAAFKPIDSISAADVEPQFRSLTRKDGTAVKTFTYYKGI